MGIAKTLWKGHVPLVRAIWLYGILGEIVFIFLFRLFVEFGAPAFKVSDKYLHGPYVGEEEGAGVWIAVLSLLVLVVCVLAWLALVTVGIWRSANNYQGPGYWAVFAKIAVIIKLLWLMQRPVCMIYPFIPHYCYYFVDLLS